MKRLFKRLPANNKLLTVCTQPWRWLWENQKLAGKYVVKITDKLPKNCRPQVTVQGVLPPLRSSLLLLLLGVPQVPIFGSIWGEKAMAQASLCPAGFTARSLDWTPTNYEGLRNLSLNLEGITTTFNFTESSPGNIIDERETLISPEVYGGLPGPNLRLNIGFPRDTGAFYDRPAPVGSSATLTINFSQPVTLATPLTFLDVDRYGARDVRNGVAYIYQDRITVTAANGSSPVNVTLSNPSADVRITGNVAEGINENSFPDQPFGNVQATPAGPVTQIRVVYEPGTEFGAPLQDETIGLARLNLCVAQPSSIGDTVFNDANGNGTQDTGETGISNIPLSLIAPGPDGNFGTGDDITRTTNTNSNGQYSFTEVPAGTYRVTVTNPPNGLVPTLTQPNPITLTSGQNIDTVDFGFAQPSSIGDTIYNDTNGNSTQDSGEPGIPGVQVTLTGPGPDGNIGTGDDTTQTTTTDNNGRYTFNNLPPGDYRVTVTNPPAGFTPTQTQPNPIAVGGGQNIDTTDFGFTQQQQGSIGDTVFRDENGNNVQDQNDRGINNVQLTLTGAGPDGNFGTADDTTRTTTTDSNGRYNFNNLPAGNYRVTVSNPPADFTATLSQPNPINLQAGQNTDTVDFGFRPGRLGAGQGNLQLVKRITAVSRNVGVNFNTFVNDQNQTNDDGLPGAQRFVGVPQLQTPLQSGDEVEYTVYFLTQGGEPVQNVRFCDLIPAGTSYRADSLSVTGSGDGANQGIFYTPLTPLADKAGGNFCLNQNNPNGAVIVNLGTIGGDNFGFVRFRVRID